MAASKVVRFENEPTADGLRHPDKRAGRRQGLAASTRMVAAFSGPSAAWGDARRLIDPLVVGVDLLLLGQRGLSLKAVS